MRPRLLPAGALSRFRGPATPRLFGNRAWVDMLLPGRQPPMRDHTATLDPRTDCVGGRGSHEIDGSDGAEPPADAGEVRRPTRRHGRLRLVLLGTVAGLVLATALAVAVLRSAERRIAAGIERRAIEAVEEGRGEAAAAVPGTRNFLVAGSDSREGLTPEQQERLVTGGPQGPPRTDTILLVQLRPADAHAAMVSFPRDLLVDLPGTGPSRINSAVAVGGPDLLVRTVESLSGLQIDHYIEVSIPAFLTVVDTVGGVEVCLDQPLHDPKSGADLPAGCQHLDPVESLAYVRSREGARGDFHRIDRQQRFLHALADEVVSARTLADVPRLLDIVERVTHSLTTDEWLGVAELRGLAQAFRGFGTGDVETATVPAYAGSHHGRSVVVPYEPGVAALFQRLASGSPIGERGHPEQRRAADVLLWTGRGANAAQVESVLFFAGFHPQPGGMAPVPVNRHAIVYSGRDDPPVAAWIANILGTEVRPLPTGAELGEDVDAVVAVGAEGDSAAHVADAGRPDRASPPGVRPTCVRCR